MAKKKATNEKPDFSFEESFDELQEIVSKLENGNLTLGDSLKSYEIGIKRLRQCYDALDQAEHKIRQLVKLDDDGNLVTSQFETSPSGDSESETTPGRRSRKKSRKKDEDSVDELF